MPLICAQRNCFLLNAASDIFAERNNGSLDAQTFDYQQAHGFNILDFSSMYFRNPCFRRRYAAIDLAEAEISCVDL